MINYAVYAVIDGHNGKSTADYIKGNLLSIVRSTINNKIDILSSQDVRQIINQSMSEVRNGIRDRVRDDSGAVMCMLLICQNHYAFGWIGDSRGVVFGRNSRGQLSKIYQTVDHNFATDGVRIKNEGGVLVKDQAGVPRLGMLNIPRAFGDKPMLNVAGFSNQFEVGPDMKFEPAVYRSIYFLLGSDGFWSIYSNPTNKREILRDVVVNFKFGQNDPRLDQFIKKIRGRAKESDDTTFIRVKLTQ